MPQTPTVDQSIAILGLSNSQLDVLDALCSTSIATLTDQESTDLASATLHNNIKPTKEQTPPQDLHEFAKLNARDAQVTPSLVQLLATTIPRDKQTLLWFVLWLFTKPWGAFIITGIRWAPFVEFTEEERESAMLGFIGSWLPDIRMLAKATQSIASFIAFGKAVKEGKAVKGELRNPFWKSIGYTGFPSEQPIPDFDKLGVWTPTFLNVEEKAVDGVFELEADVVVIGSGAGGGVVAAELAQAGLRVILLEKGQHQPFQDQTFSELDSFSNLYESRGILQSDNGSIMILAGSTVGGGTFVNWSASLAPPVSVRQEWASKHGLGFFATNEFTKSVEAVCQRIGVTASNIPHNVANQILKEGCEKIQFPVQDVPQNSAGADHKCGFCGMGCPYAQKQGTHLTFLKDAAESGAMFIQDCFVEKVTTVNGHCTGIVGRIESTGTVIQIKAKTVVSSCGSLHSPLLLTRSGLRNKNIGKNLRLHPVAFIRGYFPDRQVDSFNGPILTTLCPIVADRNNTGYGPRIEVPFMHPGFFSVLNSYQGRVDMKRKMLQFNHSSPIMIITRDYDSRAKIRQDGDGKLRIDFSLGQQDHQALVEGIIASIKILLAAGAQEIDTSQIGLDTLKLSKEEMVDPLNCGKVKTFFKEVERVGMVKKVIGSAHQMGSCRMGRDSATGAVDAEGQTFEVKGLYVADASVFPTASGVNPMVTVLSVAHHIAQRIKKALGVAVGV
ncbi:UNVERIFIED_CONTAM: hypothetical protein HDU68_000137 [Siphonaria sp. JEL0065]|nr:hypothetical protein HDU68_000137 [Siphonaria sp. JEL0065]